MIVDYPCSGTGTFRKHPELKWRWSRSELERLAAQASALLDGASAAVARGGILVAISCSIEPEENEEIGRRFLERHDEFERLPIDPFVGTFAGCRRDGEATLRFLPADEHDGFSLQVFARQRRGN
ncbi:MAG: hypothetical protein R2862_12375 [Thermoanaerobaculia bacterium]